MKKERQAAIRELLREREIQTQEDLAAALKERQFQVTQATVSRDMREMQLVKIPRENGGYQYAEPASGGSEVSDRLIRLVRDCVISAEAAGQMVVVKTMSGSANTAAEAIDSMELPEIAGSIAGDNTIFLVARDVGAAEAAAERIRGLMKEGGRR